MSNANEGLRTRIEAFSIDEGAPALTFAMRLARENGWSLDYARRTIVEYKRFAFLACTAGHPVTPSDPVDQAWHLHLTYTRSYWDRFCGQTLGRPLHHDPTRGGDDEDQKYRQQYQRTLQSYETAFGEPAPTDIWPPVDERFAQGSHRGRAARGLSLFRIRPLHQGVACVIAGVLAAGFVSMLDQRSEDHGGVSRADSVMLVLVVGFSIFAILIYLIRKFGGGGGGGGGSSCGAGFTCGADSGCSSGCGGGCGGGGD